MGRRSGEPPPEPLDAAIVFAPVGALVPEALRAVERGRRVVCAGIHMSDIPSFPYELLWGERAVRSVANLTRRDGEELLELAPRVPVRTEVTTYPRTMPTRRSTTSAAVGFVVPPCWLSKAAEREESWLTSPSRSWMSSRPCSAAACAGSAPASA